VGDPINFQSLPSKFNASISYYFNFNARKFNYSNSSISNASGPSPGAPAGVFPEAVGAPIHFHCPALAAVPPTLAPTLAGSSTGPSPGAPDGGTPESVGPPRHYQSATLAAAPPTLAPTLAGSSTGPSPGALDGWVLEDFP